MRRTPQPPATTSCRNRNSRGSRRAEISEAASGRKHQRRLAYSSRLTPVGSFPGCRRTTHVRGCLHRNIRGCIRAETSDAAAVLTHQGVVYTIPRLMGQSFCGVEAEFRPRGSSGWCHHALAARVECWCGGGGCLGASNRCCSILE